MSSAASGNNADTIKLKDLLGDPMIRECWQFNYCFDVDFLMSQFDEDVRGLVRIKIVHGSWKKEAPNRILIDVSDYHQISIRRALSPILLLLKCHSGPHPFRIVVRREVDLGVKRCNYCSVVILIN